MAVLLSHMGLAESCEPGCNAIFQTGLSVLKWDIVFRP